jgi:predicted aspartyl protease
MGRKEFTIVVFAEAEDKEVLGVHALEGLRLEVDVITGKLKEVEAVLAI